jgi:ferredoxin-NADP reductase/DMSO/TMAO reductase YedYZ heme-binding membrane subunit
MFIETIRSRISVVARWKVDRFTRYVVVINGAVPAALLAWDAWCGRLGANPVNFAIRTTGILSLIFLILSLTVTPVRRITGWSWLGEFRRVLGLFAFVHATLHFFLFFEFDRAGSVSDTASEIARRPYLMVGTLGFLLMAPLAATSTNAMIRRLGPSRWKALHRLAYVAAVAGSLHFYMLVKADVRQPIAFAAALGILFTYRITARYRQMRADARRDRVALPAATTPRPKTWAGSLRVEQVFDETPEVRTFRLACPTGPRLPFDFLPGQYLNLTLVIDGQKIRRSYSIASPPTRVGSCEITVKREERGLSSRYLHEVVQAGCALDVRAPAGRFTFTGAESDSIVMIAGGVGITPLISKIRHLTDVSWPGDIYLVFSVKAERDIIFRAELESLVRRHPNLHVTITLTREQSPGWAGEQGRISEAMLSRVIPEIGTRTAHVCGPTEMTERTRQMLRDLGVGDELIKVESFTSPGRASADSLNAPPAREPSTATWHEDREATLTFAHSGQSAAALADQTVLEAAEALGVTISYDCRAGICGQCKIKVLAGTVVMDAEDALTAADRASGLILSCQARCVDDVVVDA